MNRHTIIGHLGQDPRVNDKVVSFSVATTESYKDQAGEWQKKTSWHNVVCFGYLLKIASELQKGDKVFVEGPHESKEWTDKKGEKQKSHQITAKAIEVFGGKRQEKKQEPAEVEVDGQDFNEDDPF